MKKKFVLLAVLLMLAVGGCVAGTDESGEKTFSIDPNIAEKVEQGVAAGRAVLAILVSLGWSAGGVVVGYLGKAIQVWKVVKPKLVKAQSEAEMYHTVAMSSALAIDEFKKEYPDNWESLAGKLDEVKKDIIKPEDQLKIENIIRGLRGLPPKA